MSHFESLDLLPDDPILKLPIIFAADPKKKKVNLGIGAYKNGEGLPEVLPSVRKAEEIIYENNLNKEYLPIQGAQNFSQECLKLIFGENNPVFERTFAAQTVGGTGALKIVGDLIAYNKLSDAIHLSDPTWANHTQIFQRIGLKVMTYPYYDSINKSLKFSEMFKNISSLPKGSVVLMQPSCHNPSGLDPNIEQWKELSDLFKKKGLIPFFDFAYQGLGNSMEDDAESIRLFAKEGHEMFLAYSCSKNFGLYGERVGLLAVVADTGEIAKKIGSHIKQIIRCTYSMPPLQGERIVTTILQSKELREAWIKEVEKMRKRIHEMRTILASKLKEKIPRIDFTFLNNQKGIFSFSGLNNEQVQRLQNDFGVYMPENGRINVAGLTLNNIDYVIDSFAAVYR